MENKYKNSTEKEMESSAWNISKDYTHSLILNNLIDIQKYRTIAVFGFSRIDSDIFVKDENLRNSARLSALKRLTDTMKALIYFSRFALKTPEHKKAFIDYLKRLEKIEDNFWKLRDDKKRGNKTIGLLLHENFFDKIIQEISSLINQIINVLNECGLIFKQEERKDLNTSITQMS